MMGDIEINHIVCSDTGRHRLIVDNQWIYSWRYELKEKTYWRCTVKNCASFIHMAHSGEVLKEVKPHNHPPPVSALQKLMSRSTKYNSGDALPISHNTPTGWPARRDRGIGKGCKGLLRKAKELSESCNVEVCVVVIPKQGTIWKYATSLTVDDLMAQASNRPYKDVPPTILARVNNPKKSNPGGENTSFAESYDVNSVGATVHVTAKPMDLNESLNQMRECVMATESGVSAFGADDSNVSAISCDYGCDPSEERSTPSRPLHESNHSSEVSVTIQDSHIKKEPEDKESFVDDPEPCTSSMHPETWPPDPATVQDPSATEHDLHKSTANEYPTVDYQMRHNLFVKAQEFAVMCRCEVAVLVMPRDINEPVYRYSTQGSFAQLVVACMQRPSKNMYNSDLQVKPAPAVKRQRVD